MFQGASEGAKRGSPGLPANPKVSPCRREPPCPAYKGEVMARPFRIEGKSGWWIRYTDELGKRRKKCFEAFADAQQALDLEKARVAEVKRGLRDPTPPTKLYSDLADYWTEFKVPQKRSGSDDLSIMKAHLRPFFGEMKLADIGVAAVDRYLAEKSAPQQEDRQQPPHAAHHAAQPGLRAPLDRPGAPHQEAQDPALRRRLLATCAPATRSGGSSWRRRRRARPCSPSTRRPSTRA